MWTSAYCSVRFSIWLGSLLVALAIVPVDAHAQDATPRLIPILSQSILPRRDAAFASQGLSRYSLAAVSGDTVALTAYDVSIVTESALSGSDEVQIFRHLDPGWQREAGLLAEGSIYNLDLRGDTLAFVSDYNVRKVYIYVKSDGAWSLQQKLPLPDELVGNDPVMKLGDGFILLGWSDESAASGFWEASNVYIAERNGGTWSNITRLKVTVGASAMDISGAFAIDGQRIAVVDDKNQRVSLLSKRQGSWAATDTFSFVNESIMQGCFRGAVGINAAGVQLGLDCNNAFYDYVGSNGSWNGTRFAYPEVTDSPADSFVVSDNLAIVQGHLFTRANGQWVTQPVDNRFNDAGVTPIALGKQSDSVLVVEDGGAISDVGFWLYSFDGTRWTSKESSALPNSDTAAHSRFGTSVAYNGTVALIAAPTDSSTESPPGQVYVFRRDPAASLGRQSLDHGAWSQDLEGLKASDRQPQDGFGSSLAMSGSVAIVGGDQNAWVFTENDGHWTEAAKLVDCSPDVDTASAWGAVAIDGDRIAVGAGSHVCLFERSNGGWSNAGVVSLDGLFVQDVSIRGATLAVGTAGSRAGTVRVFTRTQAGWSKQEDVFANDEGTQDFFGQTVALADENTLIVGAPYDDNADMGMNVGAIYVFERKGSSWGKYQQKILGATDRSGGQFGWRVSTDGPDTIIASAPYYRSGTGYVSVLAKTSGGQFVEQQRIMPYADDETPSYFFGDGIAIVDGILVVGAPWDPRGTDAEGVARVFQLGGLVGFDCENADQCVDGYYCDAESGCQLPRARGAACRDASECTGGSPCVDGFCCNRLCDNQCEACDVAGSEGTCTSVKGPPHGGRPECGGSDASCLGSCDGQRSDGCVFPNLTQPCGAPHCIGSVVTRYVCDSRGGCAATAPESCSPRGCNEDATDCSNACSADRDCAAGHQCKVETAQCVSVTDECDGASVLKPAGNRVPCGDFACLAGACLTDCSSSDQCADPDTYECVDRACKKRSVTHDETEPDSGASETDTSPATNGSKPAESDDSGCGCTVPGRDMNRDVRALSVLGFGVLCAFSCRRRRVKARTSARAHDRV